MAKIDDEKGNACRKDLIECAVIEHFRWHISTDCIALEMISQNDNKHSKETVALIAKEYQIARTLKMKATDKIANIINKAQDQWPESISDRAKYCGQLAEELKRANLSHHDRLPASAVTKLIWFLKTDGWTLFDNLASKAIISQRTGENSVDRMKRFYNELEARSFLGDVKKIQNIIDQSKFKSLNGARVIDKFLMLVGMDNNRREHVMNHNKLVCNLLDSGCNSKLSELAKSIANSCEYYLLKHPEHRETI